MNLTLITLKYTKLTKYVFFSKLKQLKFYCRIKFKVGQEAVIMELEEHNQVISQFQLF
jgi:hypothetical protein